VASHGATQLNDLTGLSTSVTPSELRELLTSVIVLTLSLESAPLLGLLRSGHIPTLDLVSDAAPNVLTATITTTTSPQKSSGSVASVTLETTPLSTAHGGQGFQPDIGVGFKYCAKSSRRQRNLGLEGMPEQQVYGNADEWGKMGVNVSEFQKARGRSAKPTIAANNHPTVKPINLMKYLCRLITPPGGTILDPFAGSGSTGCAAVQEGFNFVGIEKEAEYAEIARRRIAYWSQPENQAAEKREAKRRATDRQRQIEMTTPPPGVSREEHYNNLAAMAERVIAAHEDSKREDTLF
jgi:hypothetical protein